MITPKVVVFVEGGIVQAIHSNTNLQIVIIDRDDQSVDETVIAGILEPDLIIDINSKFADQIEDISDQEREFLHSKNF
jgi:hypothetical protein